jgi:acyl carrier protein
MNTDEIKNIEQKIAKRLAAILDIPLGQVKLNIPLHELGVDSLSFVELLVFVEKEFGIKLMESSLDKEDFKTIHSLALSISKIKK